MSAPEEMTLKVIAHIRTAFPTKFGIPRQSGLVDSLRGEVIFTPEYRNADAVRGLEDFSHIWLVWQFSGAVRDSWSPTVRPPRLGGNTRMGVFATRSPFRPNPLGLSWKPSSTGLTSALSSSCGAPTLWTAPPSTTSSPTFPTPTATRTPPQASQHRPSSTT